MSFMEKLFHKYSFCFTSFSFLLKQKESYSLSKLRSYSIICAYNICIFAFNASRCLLGENENEVLNTDDSIEKRLVEFYWSGCPRFVKIKNCAKIERQQQEMNIYLIDEHDE